MAYLHNSPGRRNTRRKAALDRIARQIASGVKHNNSRTWPLAASDADRLNSEGDALALRIMPDEQARAIRTKKDRSGRGKLTRAA